MDRYAFVPVGVQHPRQLPTMALTGAFDELIGASARYGAGFYAGGARQARELAGGILVAPVPGEPMAAELAVPSPLDPSAPRLWTALTPALEAFADPGTLRPWSHVLRSASQ